MLTEVVARILATDGCPFAAVEGAMELAAIADKPPAKSPVAFVVPLAATGGANHLVTGIRQGIAERVGVVIFLRRHGDARAGAKAAELEDLYRWLRGALIGWAPSDDYDPMLFVHGSLSDLGNNEAMWMEEFATGYYHG